jgi:hypothetical protein
MRVALGKSKKEVVLTCLKPRHREICVTEHTCAIPTVFHMFLDTAVCLIFSTKYVMHVLRVASRLHTQLPANV